MRGKIYLDNAPFSVYNIPQNGTNRGVLEVIEIV